MKKFITFGLLPVALFFAGCADGADNKLFLTENVILPQTKPLAPVIDLSVEEFEELEFLNYKMFGAGGEGLTDDLDAIIKTHDVANTWNKKVKVNDGTYYIGGEDRQVIIQTDTDWTGATITIDDRNAKNLFKHVFRVVSKLPTRQISNIKTVKIFVDEDAMIADLQDKYPEREIQSLDDVYFIYDLDPNEYPRTTKLDLKLEYPSFVTINDNTKMTYRRYGGNSHGGVP